MITFQNALAYCSVELLSGEFTIEATYSFKDNMDIFNEYEKRADYIHLLNVSNDFLLVYMTYDLDGFEGQQNGVSFFKFVKQGSDLVPVERVAFENVSHNYSKVFHDKVLNRLMWMSKDEDRHQLIQVNPVTLVQTDVIDIPAFDEFSGTINLLHSNADNFYLRTDNGGLTFVRVNRETLTHDEYEFKGNMDNGQDDWYGMDEDENIYHSKGLYRVADDGFVRLVAPAGHWRNGYPRYLPAREQKIAIYHQNEFAGGG